MTTVQIEDASGYAGQADELLIPSSEAELVEIVRRGLPLTIGGAGTGVTGVEAGRLHSSGTPALRRPVK